MKAIHRISITSDLENLVSVDLPDGDIVALATEYSGGEIYVHVLAEDTADTEEYVFLFAQAVAGVAASELLDLVDFTDATYLGYVNALHVWILA